MSIRMHNTWLQIHNKQSFQTTKKCEFPKIHLVCAEREQLISVELISTALEVSNAASYETLHSRKHIQKVKRNKRWKYKWEAWQPPEPSPPTAGSSREVFKFHFPLLWITLFYISNDLLQKWSGLHRKKKRLRESGYTMKRIFMHLRKHTNTAISGDGKCIKTWFTLDLYWIITYFGAN